MYQKKNKRKKFTDNDVHANPEILIILNILLMNKKRHQKWIFKELYGSGIVFYLKGVLQ